MPSQRRWKRLAKNILFFSITFSLLANDKIVDLTLSGKYNPSQYPAIFKTVPVAYATQDGMYLHKDALEAFIEMAQNAKKAGFDIFIISAIRDFNSQKYIWESKFNGERLVNGMDLKKKYPDIRTRALKILEYSSMPGTSRHHWGTDIDIGFDLKNSGNMLNNEVYASGKGKEFYSWMLQYASDYGFCQPYKNTPKVRNPGLKHGYQQEKWHWSYQPLSSKYLKIFLKHSENYIPSGFDGSSVAKSMYLDYVQNIDKSCDELQ
ncbi:MAG: M15 family metallopeptidase [Spirochaetia bacterium]|nr:M15 family metallopeptidase [Spirochaetia bacterium]